MAAALPRIIPHRMTPWPPSPPMRISCLAIARSIRLVFVSKHSRVMAVHGLQPSGPLAINELANDNLSLEREVCRLRVGAVPGDALGLVVLELSDSLPQTVAARIQSGAGRKDLDENEALSGQPLFHSLGKLPNMIDRPTRHIDCPARVGEKREIKGALEIAKRHRRLGGAQGRGGSGLATCHTVGVVVDTNHH